jgi:hypothetical protein
MDFSRKDLKFRTVKEISIWNLAVSLSEPIFRGKSTKSWAEGDIASFQRFG